ncbi:MAG: alpha/beta fold hydrolase [Mastigocoleus sp.]
MTKVQEVQKKDISHSSKVSNLSDFLQTKKFDSSAENLQTQLQTANNLTHSFGEVQAQTLEKGAVIQPKLTIGEPGDKYEQEADRVASEVVQKLHSPEPPKPPKIQSPEDNQVQTKPIYPRIQRVSSVVQRQLNLDGGTLNNEFESSLNKSKSGGQPLQPQLRMKMENVMGNDFSGVKVHTDSKSDQLNRSVQARAFTTGKDIFFKKGEYEPQSKSGQELIAHELTHVVQQGGSQVQRLQCLRDDYEKQNVKVSGKETEIDTRDVYLEKIAHGLVYKNSLENTHKTWLEEQGFEKEWCGGGLQRPGWGVNYGLLVPDKEKPKRPGLAPVLAFRGTSSLRTLWQDFDMNSPGHGGFNKQRKKIDKYVNDHTKGAKIDVTGHSLGGALAQHYTGNNPEKVRRLVTFQSAAPNAKQYNKNINNTDENDLPEVIHHIAKGDLVDLAGGEHLEGKFFLHNVKGRNPLSHTSMLLNTEDIVGNKEGKGRHREDIKVMEGKRPYAVKSRLAEMGRLIFLNKVTGTALATVGGILGGLGYAGYKGAKAVGKGIAKGASMAWKGAKYAGRGIAKGAKYFGKGIAKGASMAWNGTKAVGTGIANGARAIGRWGRRMFSW